jgi:hypothetical protein
MSKATPYTPPRQSDRVRGSTWNLQTDASRLPQTRIGRR